MERKGTFPECYALTYEIIDNELYPLLEKKNWGFSMADCLRMIADHMEATCDIADGNDPLEAYLAKEKIEFMLEDCNFHELCGLLSNEEYVKATEWVLKDYSEEE